MWVVENGDRDEERGVPAIHAVVHLLRKRSLLDVILFDKVRPVHGDTQRPGHVPQPHPAHHLRYVLQLHAQEGREGGGGQGRRDGLN